MSVTQLSHAVASLAHAVADYESAWRALYGTNPAEGAVVRDHFNNLLLDAGKRRDAARAELSACGSDDLANIIYGGLVMASARVRDQRPACAINQHTVSQVEAFIAECVKQGRS